MRNPSNANFLIASDIRYTEGSDIYNNKIRSRRQILAEAIIVTYFNPQPVKMEDENYYFKDGEVCMIGGFEDGGKSFSCYKLGETSPFFAHHIEKYYVQNYANHKD